VDEIDLKIYRYQLESHSEVNGVVEQLQALPHQHLYVVLHAYLHNTVLVQTLKRSVEEKLPEVSFHLLKSDLKKGAEVIAFGCEDSTPEELEAKVTLLLAKKVDFLEDELRLCKQDVVHKYFYDHLTNLPNVFKLRKDLEELQELTLISISIDDFKNINSFYGFLAGDYILEEVAAFLAKQEEIEAYKMPGGEFVALVPRFYYFYDLQSFIDTFYQKLSSFSVEYMGLEISLDFTLGVCSAQEIDDILSKTAKALFYAQKHHLPFCIYEDKLEFEENFSHNIEITTKVRDAIRNDKLLAFYQPIVQTKDKTIQLFELLVRIEDNGEYLAPHSFLEIAHQTKLYPQVTKKMVRRAFKSMDGNEYAFSINITQEDIYNQETYDFIIQSLQEQKENAHRLVLELVVVSALQELEKVKTFINEVRRYGAKISIDNFGSQYASFALLSHFKVDYIKIDGGLVEQIEKNWNSLVIVESIVAIAKKLNIRVIAENVSESTIFTKVKELGIEYAQGFYIDKPRSDIGEVKM